MQVGRAVVALVVTTVAAAAHAEPLARTAEGVTFEADGSLVIGAQRIATGVRAAAATLHLAGSAVVIDATRADATREAIVVSGGRISARFPLGGSGPDAEYTHEVAVVGGAIYRYQANGRVTRCDGAPPLLFAERLEGARLVPVAVPPTQVATTPPPTALTARRDSGPAPAPPMVYQARGASAQAGARDAGGLAIPRELDDGALDTAWREDLRASAGEGQFFTFVPRTAAAHARQLRVVPGRARTRNRPRVLLVVHAGGALRVELPDGASEPSGAAYTIDLPQPIAGCLSVVLASTYGPPRGEAAIPELAVYAEGERAQGGHALLARVVADGGSGEVSAAAALARGGAAAVAAIDAELARTTQAAARRRLVAALARIADPAAAASLVRAASEGWVADRDLVDVIASLARGNQVAALRDLAARDGLAIELRAAAAGRIPPSPAGIEALLALAGRGPHPLRQAVIEALARAPVDALLAAAPAHPDAWRALTRHARAQPASRAAVVAAMRAALPTATDYERRYRLIDGLAAHGSPDDLAALAAQLAALPAAPASAALRQVAIRAIAGAPRPAAHDLVGALVADGDPGVRLAALAVLGALPDDAARDGVVIGALAGDRWPEVRRRAAAALGARCQRPTPARALATAVARDRELEVRGDALAGLVQCRAPGTGALLARTWDDGAAPVGLRTRAIDLAVELGDRNLASALVARFARWRSEAISSTPALALAQSAAAAIGRLAPPEAARALADALDDAAFPEIVSAAALGLGALGPACPETARQKLLVLARARDDAGGESAAAARRAAAQCGRQPKASPGTTW